MKKLKLKLDDLKVHTFQTNTASGQRGTVWGEQCTCDTACDTCYHTCVDTCGYNCVSLMTCDFRTCAGYATIYEQDRFCIYC